MSIFKIYKESSLPIRAIENMSYLYIIGVENKIKIGMTKNPKKRFNAILNAGGYNNAIIALSKQMLSSNIIDYEIMLHTYFIKNKIRGEWFNIIFNDAIRTINKLNYKKEIIQMRKIQISFKEIILAQDLHSKMLYVKGE